MSDVHSVIFENPVMTVLEKANSVDLDEVAQHEPPHIDLHSVPSSI